MPDSGREKRTQKGIVDSGMTNFFNKPLFDMNRIPPKGYQQQESREKCFRVSEYNGWPETSLGALGQNSEGLHRREKTSMSFSLPKACEWKIGLDKLKRVKREIPRLAPT